MARTTDELSASRFRAMGNRGWTTMEVATDTHGRLRVFCAQHNVQMRDFVDRAIHAALDMADVTGMRRRRSGRSGR
jgi:hypothetical protein